MSVADGLAWPFGGPIAVDPTHARRLILGAPGAVFLARILATPGPDTTPPAAVRDQR